MSSVEVLLINAILYTITLIVFVLKYKFSVGVLVWALYTLSSWSSFLFIQQPLYASSAHVSEQTILPCIYLYAVFLIAMLPLMKLYKIEKVDFYNRKLIRIIVIVCTVLQLVFTLVDIPTVIRVITSPTSALVSLRSTVYGDEALTMVTQNPLLNRFSLLFSGMRILATGLSVILLITNKDKRYRKLIYVFAITALANNIRKIIVEVGRGEIVFVALLYVSLLYLLRDEITEKTKRRLLVYALPIGVVGVVFFWAITISRFGNNATFYMYKYLGEPMNNFNGILYKNIRGTTNGQAYFSLIYRYIFGQTTAITAYDKWSLILRETGIRGDIFYTWVGGVIIEFGKVAPFIIAVILNRALSRLSDRPVYYAGDLFVLIFFINFYIRGIFLFPTQNFEGMFMILYTILLYLVFRIRKNEQGHLVFMRPKINHKIVIAKK